MSYFAIKHLHVLLAVVSLAGFLLRGVWMLTGSGMLEKKVVRVLPHIVDTLLLASAIALVVISAQYPFVADWVTSKVIGLVAYIALGMIALRRGRTKGVRVVAFVGALAVFGWIASVAVSKTPTGFLPF